MKNSLETSGRGRDAGLSSRLELTRAAAVRAEERQMMETIREARLPRNAQPGDVVEVAAADGTAERFRIDGRRWRIGPAGTSPEIVLRLDWPAHEGQRG